jgi:Obg family GTPase CgtA-like protein
LLDEPAVAEVESVLGSFGEVSVVSGTTGDGIDALALRLGELSSAASEQLADGGAGFAKPRAVVLRPGRTEFTVTAKAGKFRVSGRNVENWVREADFEDPRSVVQLQKKLSREGVEKELAAAGAKRGDDVLIGDQTFEFIPEGEM